MVIEFELNVHEKRKISQSVLPSLHEIKLSQMKTRKIFYKYLLELGIKNGSHNYQDYETGKRMVFKGITIVDPKLYNRLILWLTDYIGV